MPLLYEQEKQGLHHKFPNSRKYLRILGAPFMIQKMLRHPHRIPQTAVFRWLAPPLCILLVSCALQAQFRAKQVNLAYLTQRADVIVQGRVTEVVHETLPQYPNLYTLRITLSVDDMMRGPAGKTYTFREIYLGTRAKEGKKSYQTGQHLLLFLPSPSRYGLSSPIGVEQGRFHISQDSSENALVSNEAGNIGLFNDVAAAVTGSGRILTPNQRKVVSTRSGPVQLNDFLSLVKDLTSLARIQ
jgi:hypothetical protein